MPLFDATKLQERYTTPTDSTAHRFQDLALRALQELKDKPRYKPQYMRIFKLADQYAIDLQEKVEASRGKDNPGAYFLASARIALGISKRPVNNSKKY